MFLFSIEFPHLLARSSDNLERNISSGAWLEQRNSRSLSSIGLAPRVVCQLGWGRCKSVMCIVCICIVEACSCRVLV
jgi:hypothetical protein